LHGVQWLSSPRVLRQIPDWAQSLLGVNKARENKEIDEIMRHARVPAAPAPRLMQVQAPLSLAAGPNPACLAFASLFAFRVAVDAQKEELRRLLCFAAGARRRWCTLNLAAGSI
jgi:hypothetical protein